MFLFEPMTSRQPMNTVAFAAAMRRGLRSTIGQAGERNDRRITPAGKALFNAPAAASGQCELKVAACGLAAAKRWVAASNGHEQA